MELLRLLHRHLLHDGLHYYWLNHLYGLSNHDVLAKHLIRVLLRVSLHRLIYARLLGNGLANREVIVVSSF